jgi:hypothetical protein
LSFISNRCTCVRMAAKPLARIVREATKEERATKKPLRLRRDHPKKLLANNSVREFLTLAARSSSEEVHLFSVPSLTNPGSGLAEIFALAWAFIALVIGEVGLNILRWFTLGFDYAGNGFGPSTGCASPSCKPRVFLKNELSARRSSAYCCKNCSVIFRFRHCWTSPV